MKIAVWRTGHEIADTVAEAVCTGINCAPTRFECSAVLLRPIEDLKRINVFDECFADFDIHIGYGILRGMDEVFRACGNARKPWFNIDKGYWKPGHFGGYYRISLRGTQQTFGLGKLKPDHERWDKLGFEVLPPVERPEWELYCPPTDYVRAFFNLPKDYHSIGRVWTGGVRTKAMEYPLHHDLDRSTKVHTFNSSVGWEALRQGIPVMSDPTHSIVGAYQKMLDKSIHDDSNARRELFALMAGLQLSLSEIKSGALWPLLQNLLKIN